MKLFERIFWSKKVQSGRDFSLGTANFEQSRVLTRIEELTEELQKEYNETNANAQDDFSQWLKDHENSPKVRELRALQKENKEKLGKIEEKEALYSGK